MHESNHRFLFLLNNKYFSWFGQRVKCVDSYSRHTFIIDFWTYKILTKFRLIRDGKQRHWKLREKFKKKTIKLYANKRSNNYNIVNIKELHVTNEFFGFVSLHDTNIRRQCVSIQGWGDEKNSINLFEAMRCQKCVDGCVFDFGWVHNHVTSYHINNSVVMLSESLYFTFTCSFARASASFQVCSNIYLDFSSVWNLKCCKMCACYQHTWCITHIFFFLLLLLNNGKILHYSICLGQIFGWNSTHWHK